MNPMFNKLDSVLDRYEELNELLSDPEVINDTDRFMKLSKEEGNLREIVSKYRQYKKISQELSDDNDLLHSDLDEELEALTKDEIKDLTKKLEQLDQELTVLMLPKDPNDDKNIIMEIHGAAGGDEASLFAADLFNMYSKYAEKHGWKVQIID